MLFLGTGFVVLRTKFEGEALGANISAVVNRAMRGRIEVGAVHWDTGSLKKLVTGGWVPIELRQVKVWDDCVLSTAAVATDALRMDDPSEDCTPDEHPDPDPYSRRKPRKLLLRTDLITAELDVHALMFGNHDLVFRNVRLHGGEALLEQAQEPYPLHAYDKVIVSIITAFYPRMQPGFRIGIYADSAPPLFDLRDIHVENLNLTVHLQPSAIELSTPWKTIQQQAAQADEAARAAYLPPIFEDDKDRVRFAVAGRLEGINVDATPKTTNDSYLYMDQVDPLVSKFYVRLTATGARGHVRLDDKGLRSAFRIPDPLPGGGVAWPPPGRTERYNLPLTDIKVNRLAQLPTEWARREYVANSIELDIEGKTLPCPTEEEPRPDPAKGATLHFKGEIHNYWDRPYDGSWNLALAGKNLGPTVRTCINSKFGGEHLEGTVTATGPFVALPRIGLSLKNLDFDVPIRADEEPLHLTLADVQASVDLVNEVGTIDKTTALIRGGKEPGEVLLSANFGYQPYNARAHVEIVKAIDIARFLPPKVSTSVGRFLHGRLSAVGDLDKELALENFDLSLGSSPNNRALRVYNGRLFTGDKLKSLQIQNVDIQAGQSHARVNGGFDIEENAARNIVLSDAVFPDLDLWLRRFDLPAFAKSAGGGTTIIINGPIAKPKVTVATTLMGVPCLDKVHVGSAVLEGDFIEVSDLSSTGLGGKLTGKGRVNLKTTPAYAERLHLEGRRLDVSRVCGLGNKVKGILDTVDVDLAGSLAPRASPLDYLEMVELEAHADHLNVMGEAFSAFGVCINRKGDTACRGRTSYLDDDDLAQCEQAKKDRRRAPAFCAVASARRDAGGTFDATIAKLAPARDAKGKATPARMGGSVQLSDVPLSIVDGLMRATAKPGAPAEPPRIGGLASITLHLDGSPASPTATGALQLLRTWVADAFIGDAQLALAPATLPGGKPALGFRGSALSSRLQISGTLGTEAPFPVEMTISGHRVELDLFVDLQKRLNLPVPVQGWASGTITVKHQLAPPAGKVVEPEAWVELTELRATVTQKSGDGRITPLVVNAMCRIDPADPTAACAFEGDGAERIRMSFFATPRSVELACRDPKAAPGKAGRVACGTKLATPAGIVTVKGYAREKSVAIEARGTLELGQVAPMLDSMFDELVGQAELAASVTGTLAAPKFEAAIELAGVRAKPVGSDTVLAAPSGLIKLANGSLGFTDVRVQVHDERRSTGVGELHVKGNIALDGLTPVQWGLLVDGKLAGEMLLAFAPGAVSQAGGVAFIDGDIQLTGRGPRPMIEGTILFPRDVCPAGAKEMPDGSPCRRADERPLSITPRGVRKEVELESGFVEIGTTTSGARHTYGVWLGAITAKIAGEGKITDITGSFELRDGTVSGLDVTMAATSIPFKLPGTLDLILSAQNVRIRTNSDGTLLIGDKDTTIEINDGSYLQNFALTDRITSIAENTPRPRPVWEEYPLLGSAELRFRVNIRKFAIKNNIATIDLSASNLEISGTPRDPRVNGDINVVYGKFRIPGTRASFERTTGKIAFSSIEPINPELEVKSDADYRDPSGQDHVISLRIFGKLSALQWDMRTSTGYNKSQTLTLLVLGRNQEQLRRSLGDQTLGTDPTRGDPTTNPSQGFADQIVKDLAGDWVSGLLGDSLSKLTGLDVLRIEIGTGSIGIHAEKKIADNFKLIGNTEQTFRGNTNNVRAEWKTTKGVSLQGAYLNRNFNDPAEQDITDYNVKLVLRRFIW
ncbi:MAG: translocation/assembly module TamB domain-containing protein [Deltaproteobacteria bacterium]|nr:translocation/assembly module TamB domain-containing protein [Deltaproteobacteria bacterium]